MNFSILLTEYIFPVLNIKQELNYANWIYLY